MGEFVFVMCSLLCVDLLSICNVPKKCIFALQKQKIFDALMSLLFIDLHFLKYQEQKDMNSFQLKKYET